MNDVNEIMLMAPIARNARPTLHLNKSVPNASPRVRIGTSRRKPVVRIFPRTDFENPKVAPYSSFDTTNRSAQ
jgi:hypothetical protein